MRNWMVVGALCAALAGAVQAGDGGSALRAVAEEIQAAAGDHRLILLGEKHGTREIPDLVAALATAYAAEGPVLLGLEIPGSEQPALRRYLDSDGGAQARAALMATRFWNVQGDQHDGRRSHDMLDLVEHLRQLRHQGHDVSLLAYDAEPGPKPSPDARDQTMARRVAAAYAALPRGRLLVLTGHVHAMLARPRNAPPQLATPMGFFLQPQQPWSVDISAKGGEAWACFGRCGPITVPRSSHRLGPLQDDIHHHRVQLASFSIARLVGAPDAAGKD